MFLDGLSFLEEERDAWRPFEALDALSDEQLAQPVDDAHGWRGRDLMAHLTVWQQLALDVARELAVGETSPSHERADEAWERLGGEAINAGLLAEWGALPVAEVRERFRQVPGELRGYLTVVPEIRWVKDPDQLRFFLDETLDHYEEHRADLEAILAAVR